MSNTPRTDELSRQIEGYAYVPSTFARKLERELGKIQAAAISALDLFACPKRGWSGCFCAHCKLRRLVAETQNK